jgi:hypothetical protein
MNHIQEITKEVINIAKKEMVKGGNYKEVWGSNDGPQVREYLKSVGINFPASWCAAFVFYCCDQACSAQGLKNPLPVTGYCPTLAEWGIENNIVVQDPEPGDIFILKDSGSPPYFHTGIITGINQSYFNTIEGNTDGSGSSNGQGIYQRTRSYNNVIFLRWVKLIPEPTFEIIIDGQPGPEARLIDSQSWAPVRDLAQALNYKVRFSKKNKKIYLSLNK